MKKIFFVFASFFVFFACNSSKEESVSNIQVISSLSDLKAKLCRTWVSSNMEVVGDQDGSQGASLMQRLGMAAAKISVDIRPDGTYTMSLRQPTSGSWILSEDGKFLFLKADQGQGRIQQVSIESVSDQMAVIELPVFKQQVRIELTPTN
ncbi:MAG: hypothetical protein ACFCUI_12510 [Bernardetiaceae bacterium]